MKIKFYTFALSIATWMAAVAGESPITPDYTINQVYATGGRTAIAGNTILVNITNATTNISALGITFYTNPSQNAMTLSGVATFSGTSNIAQDYTTARTLTVSFPGGTMATYSIIVTKDAAPALGAGSLNSNNKLYVTSGYASTTSGLNYANVGSYSDFGSKIVYNLPRGYAGGSLYVSLYPEVGTTTLTSGATAFTKSSSYYVSNSALNINTVTTITATAQNGATRTYTLEFVTPTTPLVNDNVLGSNSSFVSFSNEISGNNVTLFYSNSANTTTFGVTLYVSKDATVTISGGATAITPSRSTYTAIEDYFSFGNITSTSTNFTIAVQAANGGAIRTYTVSKVPSFTENDISTLVPIDFSSGYVVVGRRATSYFYKIGTTLWFKSSSLSSITSTGASFSLSRVGSFKIDGATYSGQNLNWANDHTLTIFDFQGTLAKTYTIKAYIEPIGAEAYNPNPNVVNNLGIQSMQFTADNYSGNATITSEFITINLPSNKAKDKLQIYTRLGDDGSVLSLPGMLYRNNSNANFDYNFSSPVPAVVYLPNGTKLNYTITVNNTAPIVPPTPISSISGMNYFFTNGTSNYIPTGIVTSTNYTSTGTNIALRLPFGTMQNNVSLYFPMNVIVNGYGVKSIGSNNYDLTNPLTVTSFAANGVDKSVYVIEVVGIQAVNTNAGMNFYGYNSANIKDVVTNGNAVTINYKFGHDLANSVPYFGFVNNSKSASIAGVAQFSGKSKVDLTTTKIYTVLAEDGITTATYTLTGLVLPQNPVLSTLSGLDFVRLSTDGYDSYAYHPSYSTGGFNGTCIGNAFALTVNGNFNNKNFSTYFELSQGATAMVDGKPYFNRSYIVYNYGRPVTVVVTAENGIATTTFTIGVTTTVAGVRALNVEEAALSFENVVIYPNPTAQSDVTVANVGSASIVVYNLLGNVVYSTKAAETATLPTSTFTKGLYFVKITSGKTSTTKKLVVE